jgi:hypothetical protein
LDADGGLPNFFSMIQTNAPKLWNSLVFSSFTHYYPQALVVKLNYDLSEATRPKGRGFRRSAVLRSPERKISVSCHTNPAEAGLQVQRLKH